MTIDISAHLRRLVLAGLPLVSAACTQELAPASVGRSTAPIGTTTRPDATEPSCAPVRFGRDGNSPGATLINVGFHRDDPRFRDLYAACTEEGLHCERLCFDILMASKPSTPGGVTVNVCELGCDKDSGAVASIQYSTWVAGRRPEGLGGEVPSAPGTSPAAYWAACAAFEGASVTAFAVLARELERFGAPMALVARARTAAADELRHFQATAALAQRSGAGAVPFPNPASPPVRSLAAMAFENAREGCVGETYAAAVALWQAAAASDPATRVALAAIAADELTHAQLAWDVDAWVRGRTDAETGRRLAAARAEAGQALLRGSGAAVDPALVVKAGLPDAIAASRLAAAMQSSLWA